MILNSGFIHYKVFCLLRFINNKWIQKKQLTQFDWLRVNVYNLFRIVGRGGGFLYYLKYGFRLKHKTKNGLSRII
jgi:hypothetical protein